MISLDWMVVFRSGLQLICFPYHCSLITFPQTAMDLPFQLAYGPIILNCFGYKNRVYPCYQAGLWLYIGFNWKWCARHGCKLWGGSPERALIVGSVNQGQGCPPWSGIWRRPAVNLRPDEQEADKAVACGWVCHSKQSPEQKIFYKGSVFLINIWKI